MRKSKRAEYTSFLAQLGQDNIVVDLLQHGRVLQVVFEKLLNVLPDQWQKMRLFHHSTTQDKTLR